MNEVAAQNFAEKDTTMADSAMEGDDEEVAQLREYLAELQSDLKNQKAQHESEIGEIRGERGNFGEFIQKIKLHGISDDRETYKQAVTLLGVQEGSHPVLHAISGAAGQAQKHAKDEDLMPWAEQSRGQLKVLTM